MNKYRLLLFCLLFFAGSIEAPKDRPASAPQIRGPLAWKWYEENQKNLPKSPNRIPSSLQTRRTSKPSLRISIPHGHKPNNDEKSPQEHSTLDRLTALLLKTPTSTRALASESPTPKSSRQSWTDDLSLHTPTPPSRSPKHPLPSPLKSPESPISRSQSVSSAFSSPSHNTSASQESTKPKGESSEEEASSRKSQKQPQPPSPKKPVTQTPIPRFPLPPNSSKLPQPPSGHRWGPPITPTL